MPHIARVLKQERTSEGIEVDVRISGFGDPEDSKGPLYNRAKMRALVASGLAPDQFGASRITEHSTQVPVDKKDKYGRKDPFTDKKDWVPTKVRRKENYTETIDEESDIGPLNEVKARIDNIKEFGTWATLVKMWPSSERDEELSGVFSPNILPSVNTYTYRFLVTTKYSRSGV